MLAYARLTGLSEWYKYFTEIGGALHHGHWLSKEHEASAFHPVTQFSDRIAYVSTPEVPSDHAMLMRLKRAAGQDSEALLVRRKALLSSLKHISYDKTSEPVIKTGSKVRIKGDVEQGP